MVEPGIRDAKVGVHGDDSTVGGTQTEVQMEVARGAALRGGNRSFSAVGHLGT